MSQMEGARTSQSGGQGVAERVQEGVQSATDQARGEIEQQGQKVADQVRSQVDERSTDIGSRAQRMADALRQTSQNLREQQSDQEAQALERVADGMDRFGRFMQEADSDRMLREVESFGRNRPWAIALAGAGVGLLGSRLLKASASRRYESSGQWDGSTTAGPRSGYTPTGQA
jgi:ElaB/YqjD/DUF883 family membrane-anchored ribosome-binding protein